MKIDYLTLDKAISVGHTYSKFKPHPFFGEQLFFSYLASLLSYFKFLSLRFILKLFCFFQPCHIFGGIIFLLMIPLLLSIPYLILLKTER